MLQASGHILLLAVPLIAAWLYMLAGGTFGAVAYALPLGLLVLLLLAWVLYRAVLRDRWALLALLVFVSFVLNLSFRTREIGEPGLDWQNGVKIATWLVLLVISAANVRRIATLLADPVIGLFLCFATFALLSASYSPVPLYSAGCAIGLLAYIAFACLMADQIGERALIRVLVLTLAAYIGLAWVAAAVAPETAFLPPSEEEQIYRFQGLSGHPNTLAKEVAVFLCLTIAAHRRRYLSRTIGWMLLVLGAVSLLATNSRTAMLGVFVAWGAMEISSRRRWLPVLLVACLGLGLLAFMASTGPLLNSNALLSSMSRTGDAGEIMTLTGRTELWGFTWEKILEQPLLGHGFNSFEAIITPLWFGADDAAVGAHNVILQSLFTIGLLGTLPLIAAFLLLLWRLISRPEPVRDLFTAYLFVSGITEVEITTIPVLLTLVTFCVFGLDAIRQRHSAEPIALFRMDRENGLPLLHMGSCGGGQAGVGQRA